MKIKQVFFIAIIFLFIVFLSFQELSNDLLFNQADAYSYVKELASLEYKGRKPSTEGNIKALDFAQNILMQNNYNVIRQPFNAIVPFLEEVPILELVDENGATIKSFTHRVDFRETLSGYSAEGDGNLKYIIDGKSVYDIKGSIYKNSVVVVNNDYNGRAEQDLIYIKANVKALLIPTSNNNVKRATGFPGFDKSSYLGKNEKIVKFLITYDVYDTLRSKCESIDENLFVSNSVNLKFSSKVSFKNVQTENLIAYFKDADLNDKKNTKNYLGFSAHIDHLGKDPNGLYFPGALDNASGTAFTIEIAKVLSKYKEKLSIIPIILLFNAEENGLCGSYHFVKNPIINLNKLQIINSDMVGSKIPVSYTLNYYQGNKNNHPAKNFAIQLRSFGARNNFSLSLDHLSSNTDHYFFNQAGYNAVSFNQLPEQHYHTYYDDIEQVDEKELGNYGRFIESFIKENYFIKNQSFPIIYILVFLFSFLLFFKKEK